MGRAGGTLPHGMGHSAGAPRGLGERMGVQTAPWASIGRDEVTDVLAQADELVTGERWLDAIEVLHLANRTAPDPAVERRLAHVRNAAFNHLEPRSAFDEWPPPVAGGDGDGAARLPEVTPAELDAETVRLLSQKRESESASTGLHRASEGRVS